MGKAIRKIDEINRTLNQFASKDFRRKKLSLREIATLSLEKDALSAKNRQRH